MLVEIVVVVVECVIVVEVELVVDEVKSWLLFGPYTESLHEAPQISFSSPEHG